MVSDWRAGFELEPLDGMTLVTARSTFQAKSVLVQAMGPIVRLKFHRAQRAILAGLKRSSERRRCRRAEGMRAT